MRKLDVFLSGTLASAGDTGWLSLAESHDNCCISPDGHLLVMSHLETVHPLLDVLESNHPFTATFMVHVWHSNTLWMGTIKDRSRDDYTDVVHPISYGERESHSEGFTTITVAARRKKIDSILHDWKSRLLGVSPSSMLLRSNTPAIQVKLCNAELGFANNVDLTIATLLNIQHDSNAAFILGNNATSAVGKPFEMVTESVDEKYGPFEPIS